MKNKIHFTAMLISYVFSVYANNYTCQQKRVSGSQNEIIGVKTENMKNREQYYAMVKNVRINIASYFEDSLIKKGIHRIDGNAIAVCQNEN